MTAEILAVGSELLSGSITNTNAREISQALNTAGIAVKMFEALSDNHINIQMISSSEIKLSVVIAEDEADKAVAGIHAKFFGHD